MKKLLTVIAALVAITATANAKSVSRCAPNARCLGTTETFRVTQFEIDPETRLLTGNIIEGDVKVDETAKTLSLFFLRKSNCPEGKMCTMVVPAPVMKTLPIKYVVVPFCGGKIIIAEENKMPVDGLRITATLSQMTFNTCTNTAVDQAPTLNIEEEGYLRVSTGHFKASSNFELKKLVYRHY